LNPISKAFHIHSPRVTKTYLYLINETFLNQIPKQGGQYAFGACLRDKRSELKTGLVLTEVTSVSKP
jgi:hypothetical protein